MKCVTDSPVYEIHRSLASLLPLDFCLDHGVVLLGQVEMSGKTSFSAGMIRPGDRALVEEVAAKLGQPVVPVELGTSDLRRAIGRLYDLPLGESEGGLLVLDRDECGPFNPETPPARWLEAMLREAIESRATDVHLECYGRGVDLRFRIDGVLHPVPTPFTLGTVGRLVSRIKVLCQVDLAERRRAQDGRLSVIYTAGGSVRRIDFRVSVLPGPHGQDVSLRVLDPRRFILDLGGLEMPGRILGAYRRLTRFPHGLLLATGPTGAGKTTTLYATLRELQNGLLKIVSAEDPVEYEFGQVNQKSVTPQMGFADYLRAFLRSNPDVIHVGEIRDAETAEIAIRAGTTGHLVLGTLHTRDAVSAVARLRALGVSDDYLSEVLIGVLGQRLVRRLCDECKEAGPAPADLASLFYERTPDTVFYGPRGCARCQGTGYRGLVGVFELFEPSESLTEAIGKGVPVEELRRIALREGWVPLLGDALEKVEHGLTSLAELARKLTPRFRPNPGAAENSGNPRTFPLPGS